MAWYDEETLTLGNIDSSTSDWYSGKKNDPLATSWDNFKIQFGGGLQTLDDLVSKDSFLSEWGEALEESGEIGKEDYVPKFEGSLFEQEGFDKVGWAIERAKENAVGGGAAIAAAIITRGKIGPAAILSFLNLDEAATTHANNANKPVSEFSGAEKLNLTFTTALRTALDMYTPLKIGKSFNKTIRKDLEGLATTLNDFEKMGFANALMIGLKKSSAIGLAEATTEVLQDWITQITSATRGRDITADDSAGSFAAGFVGGKAFGTLSGYRDATQNKREAKQAQKILDASNLGKLQDASKEFGIGVQNYDKQYQELVDSYEGPELDVKLKELGSRNDIPDVVPELTEFKRLPKTQLSKLGTNVGDMLLSRSTDAIERQRENTKTGEAYYRLDRRLRSLSPVESGTGEFQDSLSFESLKSNNIAEFVVPFANIKDKWEKSYPLIGKFKSKVGENIDKYFGQALENKIDPALEAQVRKQVGNRFKELRKDVADTRNNFNNVRNSLAKSLGKDGLSIGFIKDYLTRGIDFQSVKADSEYFLKSLKKEYINKEGKLVKGVNIKATKDPKTKEITETAKQVRQGILNDMLNGVNPSIMTSEQIRKVKTRTGKGRPTFEKSRDGRWDRLPEEFRKKSPFDSVNDYMMNASTRLASADAFGANSANRMNDDINYLLEKEVIGSQDAEKMWDLYDAVHHTYKKPQDEASRTRQTVMRGVATLATVKYLGMATVSSITEPAWIIQRNGVLNTLKAAPTMAVHVLAGIKRSLYSGGVGKGSTSNFARDLIRLAGFALDPKNTERNQKMFAGDNDPSSLITQYTSAFFRMPAGGFLTQYTNFVRGWAGVAAIKRIQSEAKALKKMKPARRKRLEAELAENGMTLEDFASIYRAGNNKIDILNEDFLNATIIKSNGTQARVRDLMLPYLRKMITDVALQPEATNRPLWMSNPDMQLLSQLKSFPILFGNTVAKRVIRKMNPKSCTPDLMGQMSTIAAIATALGAAALAMAIKDEIRGSEREHGPIDLIGAIGIPLVGETSLSGYIGGPAVGMIDDLLSSLYGEGMLATGAKTPQEFYNIILRATTGAIGAEALQED